MDQKLFEKYSEFNKKYAINEVLPISHLCDYMIGDRKHVRSPCHSFLNWYPGPSVCGSIRQFEEFSDFYDWFFSGSPWVSHFKTLQLTTSGNKITGFVLEGTEQHQLLKNFFIASRHPWEHSSVPWWRKLRGKGLTGSEAFFIVNLFEASRDLEFKGYLKRSLTHHSCFTETVSVKRFIRNNPDLEEGLYKDTPGSSSNCIWGDSINDKPEKFTPDKTKDFKMRYGGILTKEFFLEDSLVEQMKDKR